MNLNRHRPDWSIVALAATQLVATCAFGYYLNERAAALGARAERQRAAICTIFAALPPSPPPQLQAARRVFARPGHPHDCETTPTRQRRPPAATPAPAVTPTRADMPTASPGRDARSSPPSPRSPRRPSPSPTRTPKPTPTCVLIICVP